MDHEDYPWNYKTGSSKLIEVSATIELVLELHALVVGVDLIVSDDNSTMRAHLYHIDTVKNGKQPLDVPQPSFVCDPSHHIQCMVKDIFRLALVSKGKKWVWEDRRTVNKKIHGMLDDYEQTFTSWEIQKLSKAPVEYLFAYHEWCEVHWYH